VAKLDLYILPNDTFMSIYLLSANCATLFDVEFRDVGYCPLTILLKHASYKLWNLNSTIKFVKHMIWLKNVICCKIGNKIFCYNYDF
jgi:hypothetical protein